MKKQNSIILFIFLFPLFGNCAEFNKRSGLNYFVISDHQKIKQNQIIRYHDENVFDLQNQTINIKGTKNETIAFQIILQSEIDIPEVLINVTDLKSHLGIISKKNVHTFLEWYIYAPDVPRKMVALPKGFYPDPLIPFSDPFVENRKIVTNFSIQAKKNQGIWFDIKIPKNVTSGEYTGTIEIILKNQTKKIPIKIQIYDFEIPSEWHTQTWIPLYWERFAKQEHLNSNNFFDISNWPVIYRYFKMAFEHGFWTQFSNGIEQPKLIWDENSGNLNHLSWREFDRFYSPVLSGKLFGGQKPKIWKVGGQIFWGARPGQKPNFGGNYRSDIKLTEAHKIAFSEYCSEIIKHFAEKGWTETQLFMYMIDEPDYKTFSNLPKLISDYGRTIRKVSRDKIKHLVTVAPFQSNVDDAGIDIYGTAACVLWPNQANSLQKSGKEFWLYQYHEPFIGGHGLNHDAFGFLSWPWIAKRYNINGLFYWVANFWPQKDVYTNGVNWNKNEISNGILFYPGRQLPSIGLPKIDGPISSIRMKMLRRGLLDMEYVWLAVQKNASKTEKIFKNIIRSALNVGEYFPYWKHPRWEKQGNWSHNPDDWFKAREELAKIILAN